MTMGAHSKKSGNGFASHPDSDARRRRHETKEASQELPPRFTTQERSTRDGEHQ